MLSKKHIALGVMAAAVVVLIVSGFSDPKENGFHSMEEIAMFQQLAGDLPQGENALFAGSGKCAGCHGHDLQEVANLTEEGWDINPTDYWRSSIMANSAKDPFWRAKVTHEVAVNPSHQLELEDKCTSCHAPLGHFNAHYQGQEHYSFAEMLNDSLALDGVSCNACHQQDPDGLGSSFSGELSFVTDTIYGPFGGGKDDPPIVGQPMTAFVGFEPLYGQHITKSETCAGCHTLITETADLDGESTGGTFVEQATYHEWLNSVYAQSGSEAQECQGCHMPEVDAEVILSANYPWLPPRGPNGLHSMVGANTFMLEMMRNNIDTLGISATTAQFDTSLARTFAMLQQETLDMSIEEAYLAEDSLDINVLLTNKAGHKFPSGYPARRAFVELIATDEDGNVLFHSGELQADYEVVGHDEDYEIHYDIIRDEQEVQIYEQVLGDVNGDVTTVLERAATHLKDNRLVPKGFSTLHSTYDTTSIGGFAEEDFDFNFHEEEEGSGTDEITYRIALNGYTGDVSVETRVWYQSSPPKWNEEMFSFSTPEIEFFEELYNEQGADPVLIQEDQITVAAVSVSEVEIEALFSVYPNPSTNGRVTIEGQAEHIGSTFTVYNSAGQIVDQGQIAATRQTLEIAGARGAYYLVVETSNGTFTEKVLKW